MKNLQQIRIVGTPPQEAVDASIRTLRGIKEALIYLNKALATDKMEGLLNKLKSYITILDGLKEKVFSLEELDDSLIQGLCEQNVLDTSITSEELAIFKSDIESFDINYLRAMLENVKEYLTKQIQEKLEKIGQSGNVMSEKLNKKAELLKKLFKPLSSPPSPDPYDIVDWIVDLIEALTELLNNPAVNMIYLYTWYTAYASALLKEAEPIPENMQKLMESVTKASVLYNLPIWDEIKARLPDINKTQSKQQDAIANPMDISMNLVQQYMEDAKEKSDAAEKEKSEQKEKNIF